MPKQSPRACDQKLDVFHVFHTMHIISSFVDLIIINSDQIIPVQYAKKRAKQAPIFSIKNRQESLVDAMLAPGVVKLVLMAFGNYFCYVFLLVCLVLYLVVFYDLFQGRFHLHFFELGPVEVRTGEKFVVFDVLPRSRAQPFARLEFQQGADEVFQLFAQVFVHPTPVALRVLHQSLYLPDVVDFWACEGRRIVGDFICQDAQSPKVQLLSVPLFEHHFRRIVHHGSSLRLGQLIFFQFFSQTKVSQLHIAIIEDQHVLWFQIPIDNILRMQMLDPQDDTSQDESNRVLASPPKIMHSGAFLIDQRQGISSLRPFHNEVEVFCIPEGVVQRCNEVA